MFNKTFTCFILAVFTLLLLFLILYNERPNVKRPKVRIKMKKIGQKLKRPIDQMV